MKLIVCLALVGCASTSSNNRTLVCHPVPVVLTDYTDSSRVTQTYTLQCGEPEHARPE